MAGTAEEKSQTDEKNAKRLARIRVSHRQVSHRHAERTGVRLQRGQQRLDIYRTLPLEAAPQYPTLTNNDAIFLDEVNPLLIRLVRIGQLARVRTKQAQRFVKIPLDRDFLPIGKSAEEKWRRY
jgi:hypothetical protein